MPRGGIPVTNADIVLEIVETEARIKRLREKGAIIRAEILDKIDELEDVRQADILEAFCIDCKEFEDIAEDKGYSVRRVIALYSEAINNVIL
jgi:6-phosphogluconate dehydrogenase